MEKERNRHGKRNILLSWVDMSDQNAAVGKKATKVKTQALKEVQRLQNHIGDQNNVKSGQGQSYERKSDGAAHPNIHLSHKDKASSSTLVLSSAEGSFSNAMDDESKQTVDVKVSNDQSFEDSLPVIENAGSSGKGFPYAPENWPSLGDVWTWRVGRRFARTGFWRDRSVQAPDCLRSSMGKKLVFHSRVSLEQYVRKTFPDADVDAFFASFSWRIPCSNAAKENVDASLKIIKNNGCSKSTPTVRPGDCRAKNEMCSIKAKTNSSWSLATCNICCSEPDFCRHCCCILCFKTIDWKYEGCNFIKCEAPIDEGFICGHVAHIECALRAYLAGKVGGSIDLDAQYCCRCCDNRTDLLLHVQKIIKVSESIDNKDDKRRVLNLGFCILRGSEKETAEKLRNHIATTIEKLKHGVSPDDKWKRKDKIVQPKQGKKILLSWVDMSGQNAAVGKKVTKVKTQALKEVQRLQNHIGDQNNVQSGLLVFLSFIQFLSRQFVSKCLANLT